MTYSILNELLPYIDKTTLQLREYLQSINFRVFDPIFEHYPFKEEAKYVVMFIVLAYTEESPYLIKDAESESEKEAILEKIQTPEYLREELLTLRKIYRPSDPSYAVNETESEPIVEIRKDENILLTVVNDYLDYFPSSDFQRLKQLQNSKAVLQDMINRKDFNDKDSVFSSTQFLNAIRSMEGLSKMEAKLKLEMKGKNKTKYGNLESEMNKLRDAGKRTSTTGRNPQWENIVKEYENRNVQHN